jgi:serine/threonine protein kinase
MVFTYALRGKSQVKEAVLRSEPRLLSHTIASKQNIIETLHQMQTSEKNEYEKKKLFLIEKEVQAISKIPYVRHKLSSIEILKICMVANRLLQEACIAKSVLYLRASDTGLGRAIVIDGKRGAFTILSKRYGKLFASGTFKKVTDAIDVTTENGIAAKRVVRLVNKAGKPFHEKELALHERFGLVLTRVDYLSKKWQNELKTTVIEEAYDHDMHVFTNHEKYTKKTKIRVEELVEVLSQLVEQVAIMHKDGFAHRDIKTKNVLFRREPEDEIKVRLIDFGHAIKMAASATTKKDRYHHYGTVRYGSPELLDSSYLLPQLVAQRQAEDMYALGCFLYELLFFKQIPWAKEYYQAAKEQHNLEMRVTTLAKQRETYQQLVAAYADPETVFEKLAAVCFCLLDPNPKTRMTITQLSGVISSLRGVY